MAGRGCSDFLETFCSFGGSVRFVVLGACLLLAGCSQPRLDSAATSSELIPAEWTVAEDTSAAGDVTTASLQLPAAREISGLVAEENARLVLRCMDHKVEAYIDTEGADTASTGPQMVAIQIDSAPACE
jgi:hypothetical protein